MQVEIFPPTPAIGSNFSSILLGNTSWLDQATERRLLQFSNLLNE